MFFIVEVDNDGFKVLDSTGAVIDPAEDSTVAAITTELQAIQATTGVKAIIDPLPAGTNNIGDVDIASAIPAGSNIIGTIKLVDSAGVNLLAVDGSGRVAIQNQPNMDVALSTRATEATLAAADAKLGTIDAVLDSIKDVDGIKKITDPLPAGDNNIGNVDVVSSALPAGAATEVTLAEVNARLGDETTPAAGTVNKQLETLNAKDFSTETTLAALLAAFNAEDFASETSLAAFKAAFDSRDLATQTTLAALLSKNTEIDAVLDTIFTRQNDRSQKTQLTNGTLDVTVTQDATVNRLEISGKVQSVGAVPPPSTTPVVISADNPLLVGTHDTTYTIPSGQTFHLQQITAGNEDPTKGAVTVVLFNNGTEHVIERVYSAGFTVQAGFSDITKARDGTALLGNGTNTIVVRRTKYSGSNIAIDAEVVGYVS